MPHEVVCCKCSIPMYPRKNRVWVLDMEYGEKLDVWSGDKWRCPKCKMEVIAGFGGGPIGMASEFDLGTLPVDVTMHLTICDYSKTGIRALDESVEWEREHGIVAEAKRVSDYMKSKEEN